MKVTNDSHIEGKAEEFIDKYDIIISYSKEDDCYDASVPALKGCMSHGSTPEEAIKNGRDAILSWIDIAIQDGDPLPLFDKKYSGIFNIRVPRSLHRDLAKKAQRENVSLNQYVMHILSKVI